MAQSDVRLTEREKQALRDVANGESLGPSGPRRAAFRRAKKKLGLWGYFRHEPHLVSRRAVELGLIGRDDPSTEQKFAAKYPEHVKLAAIRDRSQAIGEFLEWLPTYKVLVSNGEEAFDPDFPEEQNEAYKEAEMPCAIGVRDPWAMGGGWLQPCYVKTEQLLADYFGIDLKKIEDEKQAMLQEIRERTSRTGSGKPLGTKECGNP